MLPDASDAALLLHFAETRADDVFAEVVRRHIDGVYSAALRRVGGDTHLAEDVTQQVFAALAADARRLAQHTVLVAWLYATTRNHAANVVRRERRRKTREQQAMPDLLSSATHEEPDWSRIAPLLDDAIDQLGEADRHAVLLRFMDRRPFREIGTALQLTEDAARMRVERALEKLRVQLGRRGLTSTSAALGLALADHAIIAAPPTLATSIANGAAANLAWSGPSATLLNAMSSVKSLVAVVAAVAVIASLGTAIYEARARRTAEDSLVAAGQKLGALVVKQRELEAQAKSAEQNGAQLQRQMADARDARAAEARSTARESGSTESAWDPTAQGREFLARHGEVKKALYDFAKARVDFSYHELFKALQLAPEKMETLRAMLARGMGMGAPGPRGADDTRYISLATEYSFVSGFRTDVQALLGPDDFQKYDDYAGRQSARDVTVRVAASLWFTDTPITPELADRLVGIFASSLTRRPARGMLDQFDWDAVMAKAAEVLSEPQLAALVGLQAEKQFNQVLNRPAAAKPAPAK